MFNVGDPARHLSTMLHVLIVGWMLVRGKKKPPIPAVFVRLGQSRLIVRNKLRKSLGDAILRAVQRGRQHWTSAFPHIEAWITSRPDSTAASSKPGSEISFLVDSGNNFSNNNVIIISTGTLNGDLKVHESIGVTTNMAGAALPPPSAAMLLSVAALPLTPGAIQTSDVPIKLP